MPSTRAIGDIGEQLAAEYLERSGYEILERNAVYCNCEADIICCGYLKADGTVDKHSALKERFKSLFKQDKSRIAEKDKCKRVIVFCEVKTRGNDRFGGGLEAVTPYKAGRYVTLAKAYIAKHFAYDDDIRFDIIEVDENGAINHIENAFTENDARYPRKR